MRDKFSELIKSGVAKFEYTNTAPVTPTQDPLVRFYNNIFGMPSDTHMTKLFDGRYIITGSMVKTDKFDNFVCSQYWGGIDFKSHTYPYRGSVDIEIYSAIDLFYLYGYDYKIDAVNGDVVVVLVPVEEMGGPYEEPSAYTTTESKIPKPLRELTTNGREEHIKECLRSNSPIKSLNESLYVLGNNWKSANGKIIGQVNNKIVIL